MSFTQAWLEDQNTRKIVLVECTVYDTVAAQDVSIYLSNGGYITTDGSVSFKPIIVGDVSFTEKLNKDAVVSMSYGDIGLNNRNGEIDSYLSSQYIWINRPITIYYGDPSWAAANIAAIQAGNIFTVIFRGVMADISSSSKDILNIKLRDKLEKLNTPLTETKIGTYGVWPGGQQNQDTISPVVFGEVHNFTPVLIDPSTLEYRFNTGDTEQLVEVRDNGVPVSVTANVSNGTFKLASPSVGALTCSIQGVKRSVDLSTGSIINTYENNVGKLIALIVRQYGSNPLNRLTSAELDLAQLSAYSSEFDNLFSVGIVVSGRENVLQVCQQLASSLGSQVCMTRTGLLRLLKYGAATAGVASVAITDNDMILGSLALAERVPVVAATKIGYAKNWTIQQNLVTAIPQQHKELFSEEWLSVTIEDATVKTRYRIEGDPVQKDTMLIATNEATEEATRLNNFFKVQRHVYRFTGSARLLSLQLGQAVTLYHPTRFNLSSAPSGQVVGLIPNWTKQQVEVEVLI